MALHLAEQHGPAAVPHLCGDLVRAVRVESAAAIKHHFGVGGNTVWQWRKALGVDRVNVGTSALFSRNAPDTVQSEAATSKLADALKSPERGAKISAAKRGVKRSPETIEKMRRARLGTKASDESRERMSEAQKRRGVLPPGMRGPVWTDADTALLGTMPDADFAEQTGRTLGAVRERRYYLGVERFKVKGVGN